MPTIIDKEIERAVEGKLTAVAPRRMPAPPATRPAQPDGEWIWFDRRPRPLSLPQGAAPAPDAGRHLVAWLQAEAARQG